MEIVRMAVVGLGNRGYGLMKNAIMPIEGVEIAGVCDIYEDRLQRAADYVKDKNGISPYASVDYRNMLLKTKPDAALVATGWEMHTEIAVFCMENGIVPAVEVGALFSEEECRLLVDTYEKTGTRIMMMENCCFNKSEMLVTAMARAGLFGEIVHCAGAYGHDLRKEILSSEENRHYRLDFYRKHNCENYPTHELGPIAKLLDINRGNRMVSLVSMSSKAVGFADYVQKHDDTINPNRKGEKILQGDVFSTLITCERGETILLRLDTSLPRFYNREFTVRGTNGLYEMGPNLVYFDGMKESFDTLWNYREYINNASQYEEEYLPESWKKMSAEGLKSGHGGMDGIEFRAFINCLRNGLPMPVDVYDMAAWVSIGYLSEISVKNGSAPVAIPDFTHGEYKTRERYDVFRALETV